MQKLNRVLLRTLLTIGIATTFVGGSHAWFLDNITVRDNAFAAGTLEIATEPASGFIGMQDMQPGDSVTQNLKVKNGGSLGVKFRMMAQKQSGSDLFFEVLRAKVVYAGPVVSERGQTVYEGPLSGLGQAADVGGRIDPAGVTYDPDAGNRGDCAEYAVTVELPTAVSDDYTGKSAVLRMAIDATQIGNPAWTE